MPDAHGEREGGVAQHDREHVDGEPHVVPEDGHEGRDGGVEDRHVVRDEERDRGDRGRARPEVARLVDRLEDEGEEHPAPGHEHDRLVHVGDRRPARDQDPQDHAVGVEREAGDERGEARPSEPARGEGEAREEGQEAEEVEDPGGPEGLEAVVVDLHLQVLAARVDGRGQLGEAAAEGGSRGRDARPVALPIGDDEGARERAHPLHLGQGHGLRGRQVGDRVPRGLGVIGVGHDVERLARHDALVGEEGVVEVEDLSVHGVRSSLRSSFPRTRATACCRPSWSASSWKL